LSVRTRGSNVISPRGSAFLIRRMTSASSRFAESINCVSVEPTVLMAGLSFVSASSEISGMASQSA
jgi:hypothetical protein